MKYFPTAFAFICCLLLAHSCISDPAPFSSCYDQEAPDEKIREELATLKIKLGGDITIDELHALAVCSAKIEDYISAVKYFDRVIDLDSDYMDIYLDKGVALYFSGDVKQGVQTIEREFIRPYINYKAYIGLSYLYKKDGNKKDAFNTLIRASNRIEMVKVTDPKTQFRINSGELDVFFSLINILLEERKYDDVEVYIKKALFRNSGSQEFMKFSYGFYEKYRPEKLEEFLSVHCGYIGYRHFDKCLKKD